MLALIMPEGVQHVVLGQVVDLFHSSFLNFLSRKLLVRKSVSRRDCFVLHLHFNQLGKPTFIILNDLLSLNINVQCTMYIVHVHVTSMIKCFGNIFIFFRLEMFTRRKSTAWTYS